MQSRSDNPRPLSADSLTKLRVILERENDRTFSPEEVERIALSLVRFYDSLVKNDLGIGWHAKGEKRLNGDIE